MPARNLIAALRAGESDGRPGNPAAAQMIQIADNSAIAFWMFRLPIFSTMSPARLALVAGMLSRFRRST